MSGLALTVVLLEWTSVLAALPGPWKVALGGVWKAGCAGMIARQPEAALAFAFVIGGGACAG